jgi:hypothetical protein
MKFRNGFVSNSSSSSFVAIIKSNTYDGLVDSSDLFTRKILKTISTGNKCLENSMYTILNWGSKNYGTLDLLMEKSEIVDMIPKYPNEYEGELEEDEFDEDELNEWQEEYMRGKLMEVIYRVEEMGKNNLAIVCQIYD